MDELGVRGKNILTESSEFGKYKFDASKINDDLLTDVSDALTTATGN
jgi:hypothetical protein